MEIDGGDPGYVQYIAPSQQQGVANVLCCNCGIGIDASRNNGLAICTDCIKLTTDISEGIQREAALHFCTGCERWLQPPQHWVNAQPESRELLALCLKKLRGLNKVRIIDASFIWTEPHSKRVKVKITIQSEAFQNTILQQSFEVEYVVTYTQCADCAKSYTAHTWRACVQVRQKVPHKRTFLFLEQLIIKHRAHLETTNIKEAKDGLDFFYSQRSHAVKMVDFLSTVAPIKMKKSEELISQDIHTSTKSFKFTFSIELVPICKDDMVCLPLKIARNLGNIPQVVLCSKVGNSTHFLDPNTLQTAELDTKVYWRTPFTSLADVTELVEFVVLDIEPLGPVRGRWVLADAQVAKASDMGHNDKTYMVRTHLGGVLHPGDSAMGYALAGSNFNNPNLEELELRDPERIPEVILVKKHYLRRKKNKNRNWKLRRMAKEESEMLPRKQDQEKAERDFELFLKDIEEDEELRNTLQLYKNTTKTQRMQVDEEKKEEDTEMETDGEDELPEIDIDQLLDEFEDLRMTEKPAPAVPTDDTMAI